MKVDKTLVSFALKDEALETVSGGRMPGSFGKSTFFRCKGGHLFGVLGNLMYNGPRKCRRCPEQAYPCQYI